MARTLKKERQEFLLEQLKHNPFLKDEELARACKVSISTIRFDRAELGISEYRERIRYAAKHSFDAAVRGDVLDLDLFHNGISVLETNDSMLFEGSRLVKGQCIYAFAENLALKVINARSALVKVANVKYIREIHSGERLIARSEVMRVKENEFIVHVFIRANMNEVFRGKFSLLVTEIKPSEELHENNN